MRGYTFHGHVALMFTCILMSFQLLELQCLRLEWFIVLTDTEGHHDTRGSELGEEFLKVSSDTTARFAQYCKGKCK